MKLGAAPEIDRHTLQLSEACPAVATSLRVMNSHVDISRRPGLQLLLRKCALRRGDPQFTIKTTGNHQ